MKEITKIFELCLEISTTTEHDVFFKYSPHINSFYVYYYKGGRNSCIESVYAGTGGSNIYSYIYIHDSDKIKEVISELNELKDTK